MSLRHRLIQAALAAGVLAGLLVDPAAAVAAAGPTTLPAGQYTLTAELPQVRHRQHRARLDAGHRGRPHGDGEREPRPHGTAVVVLRPRPLDRFPVRQRGQLRLHELPAGHHDQPRRGRHREQRQLRRAPARRWSAGTPRTAAAATRPAAGSPWSTGTPPTPTSTGRSCSSSRPAPRRRRTSRTSRSTRAGCPGTATTSTSPTPGTACGSSTCARSSRRTPVARPTRSGTRPGARTTRTTTRYVLPQVGTITSDTTSGTNLAWSSISLDRVSKSIVMTEYTCQSGCTDYPNRAPRAIRYPFASGADDVRRDDHREPGAAAALVQPQRRGVAQRPLVVQLLRPEAAVLLDADRGPVDVLLGGQRRKPLLLGRRHRAPICCGPCRRAWAAATSSR